MTLRPSSIAAAVSSRFNSKNIHFNHLIVTLNCRSTLQGRTLFSRWRGKKLSEKVRPHQAGGRAARPLPLRRKLLMRFQPGLAGAYSVVRGTLAVHHMLHSSAKMRRTVSTSLSGASTISSSCTCSNEGGAFLIPQALPHMHHGQLDDNHGRALWIWACCRPHPLAFGAVPGSWNWPAPAGAQRRQPSKRFRWPFSLAWAMQSPITPSTCPRGRCQR